MADALVWLNELPFGTFLYATVAVGLAAFGVYNFIEARYRIVRGPKLENIRHAVPGLQ